ncbi:hypothetical protein ACH4TQ_49600 [Streptomyces sp. NPDC021218]|uniref:hypothetical protein n=1 Tax=Streptomyces sp. NPDC021218 TaxID=3365119 RepID=UPI00378983F3
MTGFTTVVAVLALLTGYGAGRVRPWRRLGDWAQDQVRFAGPWARGGTIHQAVLVLAHFITAPPLFTSHDRHAGLEGWSAK